MRNLSKWNKELKKIMTMFQEFTEITSTHGLSEDDVEIASTQLMVNKISKEVKDVEKTVEKENNLRELYTLDLAIVDKVKLPTFEGKHDEDYTRFKADMEKGFAQNRVTRVDKVAKLRECLKGHARRLVPDSITLDIEEAWDVLDKAYGDPTRLMKSRTEALNRMGQLPRENGKKGIKGQVEWYIELESLLQNMLILGRSSSNLGMIVFQPLYINDVYNLFPTSLANKLIKCEGTADKHFEKVLNKISQFRADAQKLQIAREARKPSENSHKDDQGQGGGRERKFGNFGYGGTSGGRSQKQYDANLVPLNLITHNPPIRDEKCRICNTLEAHGDTRQLYDGHVSNYPTGCPRYVGMAVNRRYQVALEAKLCLACHHPEYIFKKNDRDHKCSVVSSKRKGRFTCQSSGCFIHLWVCTRHKSTNMPHLEKFKEEIRSKYNLEFGFVVSIPILSSQNGKNHFKQPDKGHALEVDKKEAKLIEVEEPKES